MADLLQTVLYQTIQSMADASWELRRMGQQVGYNISNKCQQKLKTDIVSLNQGAPSRAQTQWAYHYSFVIVTDFCKSRDYWLDNTLQQFL